MKRDKKLQKGIAVLKGPFIMEIYPRALIEFEKQFSTEEQCRDYLIYEYVNMISGQERPKTK